MAAPARPEDVASPQNQNRASVGLDDIGDLGDGDTGDQPKATPQDLFNQRLDGDSIPEHLRGKTIAEALSYANSLGEALEESSERARTDMAKFADRPVNVQAPVAAPVEQAVKSYTEEEINQMFQDNPAKAIQAIWNSADALVERRVEQRIAPIRNAALSTAEARARQEYALEFELFGDQIKQMYDTTPDKSIFSNPQAWGDMVRFIRGDPANIDKYVERKAGGGAATAGTTQAASAGFHVPATQHTPKAPTTDVLNDPIKREIADQMGMSYADYVKWEGLAQ